MGVVMTGILCFLLAGISLICSILGFAKKGVCLNNSYLFASREERETMDLEPYYRQSGIVFCFVSLAFFFIGLYAFVRAPWMVGVAIGLAVLGVIYAIVSSIWESVKK